MASGDICCVEQTVFRSHSLPMSQRYSRTSIAHPLKNRNGNRRREGRKDRNYILSWQEGAIRFWGPSGSRFDCGRKGDSGLGRIIRSNADRTPRI